MEKYNIDFLKNLYKLIGLEPVIVTGAFTEGKETARKVTKFEYYWKLGSIPSGLYSLNGTEFLFPSDLIGAENLAYYIDNIEIQGSVNVSFAINTTLVGGLSMDNVARFTSSDGTVDVNYVNVGTNAIKLKIENTLPINTNVLIKIRGLKIEAGSNMEVKV